MAHGDGVAANAIADLETADEQAGYLWRWSGSCFTSAVNDSTQQTVLREDLKSKRRFPTRDHELLLVLTASVSSITVNVDGIVRVLVLKS